MLFTIWIRTDVNTCLFYLVNVKLLDQIGILLFYLAIDYPMMVSADLWSVMAVVGCRNIDEELAIRLTLFYNLISNSYLF